MKAFVEKQLAKYASTLIKKQKPFIVGVTGSVGKSSAKDCMGAVLGGGFNTLTSPKNYNTEFGLPLAILGLESGGKSAWKWLCNLRKGWWKAKLGVKEYPDTLVLEMAADHPGDITKLVKIAPPDIGVVTAVGESHFQFFGSKKEIAKEKSVLAQSVPEGGLVVLNRDDELVWEMRRLTKARVISIGFHEEADIHALADTVKLVCHEGEGCGTSFKVKVAGQTVPFFIHGALGWPTIYSVLCGIAVGMERGLNLVQISERLQHFNPPAGRLHYLAGIKQTILIDDSYNAAPTSVNAALDVLKELPLGAEDDKRFAILGDMLELGLVAEEAHRDLGRKVAEKDIDYLVLVGELMNETKKAAIEAGMDEDRVVQFSTNLEAGKFVQAKMKPGDVVLVKGSRAMQMEYVVKELMADPLRAAELLPGDHDEWRL